MEQCGDRQSLLCGASTADLHAERSQTVRRSVWRSIIESGRDIPLPIDSATTADESFCALSTNKTCPNGIRMHDFFSERLCYDKR